MKIILYAVFLFWLFSQTMLLLNSIGLVEWRSRMLAFRGAGDKPPQHEAPAGSHLLSIPTGVSHLPHQST
jgi:hypothetical protein